MADKKLKRPDFILQKDFFVKNDANEQETGPKKQKQKSSKRNQEAPNYLLVLQMAQQRAIEAEAGFPL